MVKRLKDHAPSGKRPKVQGYILIKEPNCVNHIYTDPILTVEYRTSKIIKYNKHVKQWHKKHKENEASDIRKQNIIFLIKGVQYTAAIRAPESNSTKIIKS